MAPAAMFGLGRGKEQNGNASHEAPRVGSHGKPLLTTGGGHPVSNDDSSLTIGDSGTITMEDFHFFDKQAHFSRERVPERIVHAKGMGAHGVFQVTKDITDICKTSLFSEVGKQTPVLSRFSTVAGESGSIDTARDPRGFSLKFYTEDGIWDMVGNNTPVFFVRDAQKFPDLIHSQKRNPQTHLKDADSFWDFLSLVPESIHQVLILFSPRGVPDGHRHMNGYGSHTYKWTNAKGESHWVKFHFKTDQGIKNLTHEEAITIGGIDPDYSTRDLVEAIESGNFPSWTFYVQVMPFEDAWKQKLDPFDLTKVWSHKEYPLREVGKVTLNRNVENYFAEIEQASFSPAHMPAGIDASPDRVLQARLFAYEDAARYRVGTNYLQLPVNRCPFAKVQNYQRDGAMAVAGNGGKKKNYYPNSFDDEPKPDSAHPDVTPYMHEGGIVGRYSPKIWAAQDDYEQPRQLWQLMSAAEQEQTVANIAGHLGMAVAHIQQRQLDVFRKVNAQLAEKVETVMKEKAAKVKSIDKFRKMKQPAAESKAIWA